MSLISSRARSRLSPVKTAAVTIYSDDEGNAMAVNKLGKIIAGPIDDHVHVFRKSIDYVSGLGGGKISVVHGVYNLPDIVYLKPNIHIDFGFSILRKLKYAVFQKDPAVGDLENVVVENAILDIEGAPKVVFYGQVFRSTFRNIFVRNIGSDSAIFYFTSALNVELENIHGRTVDGVNNARLVYLRSPSNVIKITSVELNNCSLWVTSGRGYLVWATGTGSTGFVQHLNIFNSTTIGGSADIRIEGTVQHINIIGVNSGGGLYIDDTTGNMRGPIIVMGSLFATADINAGNALVRFIGGSVTSINVRSGTVDITELDVTTSVTVSGGRVIDRNTGVSVIAANATSTRVSHGLRVRPSRVVVTPLAQPAGKIWVENITDTTFDIVTDVAPATDLPIAWIAES